MNDDYVILIDENGQPYIAHSVMGNIRSGWEQHKFIKKVQLPNGKWRYFYDAAELKAFYDHMKQGTKTDLQNTKANVQQTITNNKNRTLGSIRNVKNTAKYFTQKGKMSEDERNALREEMLATRSGRAALKTASAVKNAGNTIGTKAKAATKWADEHDAGLTETMRYARNRKTTDQETKDRLHDEMTSTKIGKLASKMGSLPQTVPSAVSKAVKQAKELLAKADPNITISGNTITGYGRSVTIPEELMNNAYAIYGLGMGLFNKKDKE